MRQHVNPLSSHYDQIISIPSISEIFKNPSLPLHLDLGSGKGEFLFELALQNQNWNYMGIEIKEKLIIKAKRKLELHYNFLENIYFAFGNAENLIDDLMLNLTPKKVFQSISFNFPDPWFKKKHHKRRIVQDKFVKSLSQLMPPKALLIVKSDVNQLFEYMDSVILNTKYFSKIDNNSIKYDNFFNPRGVLTDREKYIKLKKLTVFEQTYIRV